MRNSELPTFSPQASQSAKPLQFLMKYDINLFKAESKGTKRENQILLVIEMSLKITTSS